MRRPSGARRTKHSPDRFPPRRAPSPSAPQRAASADLPYVLTAQLLSTAEQDFLRALTQATPSHLTIYPQVRLAGLVHVAPARRTDYATFNRIAAKTVDFVLCDAATTAPRLVVELDDSSHHRADRRARDEFVDAVLASVGLPILHVPWARSYDVARLARSINAALDAAAQPAAPALPDLRVAPVGLAPVAAPAMAQRYVCGACQFAIGRDAAFCPSCGTALALPR